MSQKNFHKRIEYSEGKETDSRVHHQSKKSKKHESESHPEISSSHAASSYSTRKNDVSSGAKRSGQIRSHHSANDSEFTRAGPSGQTDIEISIPRHVSYGKIKREIIWQKSSGINARVSRHERATLPKFSTITENRRSHVHREILKEEKKGGVMPRVENTANPSKKKADTLRSSKSTEAPSAFRQSKMRSTVPTADCCDTLASPVNRKRSDKLARKDLIAEKTFKNGESKRIRRKEIFPTEKKPVVSFNIECSTNIPPIPPDTQSDGNTAKEEIKKCGFSYGDTTESATERLRREVLSRRKNYVSKETKRMYRQHASRRNIHKVMERNEPYVGLALYKKGSESREEKESPKQAVLTSLDAAIKRNARGLLLQSMFLALVTTIAVGMASVDTYYFTDMTEKLFYRTPPILPTDNITEDQSWEQKPNRTKFTRASQELTPEARQNGKHGKPRYKTQGTSSVSLYTGGLCNTTSSPDSSPYGKTEKISPAFLCNDFPKAASSLTTISNASNRGDLKHESSKNIRHPSMVLTNEFPANVIYPKIKEKHGAKILLHASERFSATSSNPACMRSKDFVNIPFPVISRSDNLSVFSDEPLLTSLPANDLHSYGNIAACDGGVVSLLKTVKRAAVEATDINCHCCPRKSLEESHTISDFWMFAETTMIQMLYWEFWFQYLVPENHDEDYKKNFFQSQIFGVPRLRQVRVKGDSCFIHPSVSRFFNECYNYYSLYSEETRPIRNDMEGTLTEVAWKYTDYKELNSTYYFGKVSTYGGGGYYIDLSLDINETTEMIKELKDHTWITKSTRAVFVDFTIYNVNVNLFCVCKIVFEFPPTGGMIPKADFSSLKFLRYLSKWDFFILGCELFFAIFVLFYTIDQLLRLKKLKTQFFRLFWSYIDIIVLLLSYAFIIYSVFRFLIIEDFVKNLPLKTGEHVDFWHIRNVQEYHNYLVAVLVFFSWVQLIQYLNFTQTMMELRAALRRSVGDVFGFALLFFIIFFAFAQVAYLLFGSQLEEYSSLWTSCMTLLQAVIGEFEYRHLEDANRVAAPIFFINMFLAIINDSYAAVKSEIDLNNVKTEDRIRNACLNVFGFCLCGLAKKFRKKGGKYHTYAEIKEILQRSGFSDIEVEVFFRKYNINLNQVMSESENRRIINDLELKGLDFNLSQEQARLDELTRKVNRLNDRITEMQRDLQPVINKIDFILTRLTL